MQQLIKNVQIVDPASPHHLSVVDLRIELGNITAIAPSIPATEQDQVIEATGKSISTGWIDLLAAAGDPGEEYREDLLSLSRAAEKGGFSGLGYMPSTQPAIQTKADVEYVLNKTAGGKVRFHPLGALTKDRAGKELTEIYDMRNAGAAAFTDAFHPVKDAGIMLRTLQYVKLFDGTIINIPSDHTIVGNATINEGTMSTNLGMYGIPDVLEEIMVERYIKLAEYAGSRLHLACISSARSLEHIRAAKKRGVRVTASVTPYHLYFDETAVGSYDTTYKVNPPLRTAADVASLKDAVADGTIDVITSFHLPYDSDAKECEFEYAAFGMAGIETCFAAAFTAMAGVADITRLIACFTSEPRKVLGLDQVIIQVGSTCPLTLFDTTNQWTVSTSDLLSKGINNPFIGKTLNGNAIATLNVNPKTNI